MANNFSIELTGRLNRAETIKNINSELAKIANSNQLNGINLEISQITLSNQAREFLQHLDITAEINHIVADAGEMRRQGEQLGEQVTEGLNRGINRSDRIIQNFRKSLENIRFNPLNNSGQGFLDETEIDRIIAHLQGIRNESGQTVVAIENLKATLTETTGKNGKTLLNVRVSGLDELGQAINMTQQWEINSEGLSKELNRTVTDVATATEKAASTTTSFLTKQTNAVAKYNREVATLQAKITDQNAVKPILDTGHLSQINTQINLINSRIQTLASSTAGTFTQAENDVKQEINQLKILADSFRLAETAATALRAKPVDVVRKETLSKLDAFAQKVKKAQGDTSGFVGIITTAQAALKNEEITAAQLREVLDSLAIGTSKLTLHNEIERTTTALDKAKTEAESLLKAVRDLNQKGELNDFTASIRGTEVTFADLENKIKEMSETGKGSLSLLRSELNAFIADAKRSGKLSGTKESDKNTIFQNNITQWVEDNKQALSNFDDVFREKITNITESAKNADNITLNGLKNQFKNIQDVYKFLDEFSLGKTEANFVRLQSQFNQFGSSVQSENSALQGLKTSFTELQGAIRSNDFNRIKAAMEQYNRSVKTAQASLTTLRAEQKKVNEFANARLSNRIDDWLRKNTKAAKDYGAQLEQIKKQTEGADAITLKRLRAEFDAIKKAAADAGKLGKNFFETLKEGATKFTEWVMASGMIMQTVYAFKQMLVEVKNIDTAMTNLYKVTDETEGKYNEFLKTSYTNAQRLGRSVTDLVEMTANWAKLGYGIDEATKLAEASTIYANVGEVDAETSVSDLVTAMKAFNIAAEDSITIVDKLNRLGNEFAVSSRDLGDGLQNSASMLAMGGNTIEETLALITGGAEITQSTEEVSTALRIGQMRVQGMKGALEELGETVDDDVESISKMQTHILNLTKGKVNIFDANNQFRSYYDILQDISTVIDSLSSTERADLIETLFGKNRANQGAAVIQAFQSGQVQKALEAATNAEGSALAEQQKWLESTEAKLQQFSAAWQAFSNTIINSDVVKFFIDSSTGALSTLTKIVDAIGDIPTAMAIAMSAVAIKSGGIIQNLNGELGVFGKTLSSIKKDFGTGQGLLYSIFGTGLNGSDKEILHSIAIGFQDASVSAEQLNEQAKGLSVAGRQIYKDFVTGKISLEEFAAAEETATLSSKALTVALNVGIIAAITAVASVISYVIRKQEEATQAAIQAGQAAKTESENLIDLRNSYLEAQNSLDGTEQSKQNLETATDSLLDALGIEREQVQGLADDYSNLKEVIDANTLASLKSNAPQLESAMREQEKALVKIAQKNQVPFEESTLGKIVLGDSSEADVAINRAIADSGLADIIRETSGDYSVQKLFLGNIENAEDAINNYKKLDAVIQYIDDLGRRSVDWQSAINNSANYQTLLTVLTNLKEQINTTTEAQNAYIDNEKQIWGIETARQLSNAKNIEQFNQIKQALIDNAIASQKWAGSEDEVRASLEQLLKMQPELKEFYQETLTPSVDTEKTKEDLEKELKSLQKGGNVNLELRPVIKAKDLKDAGWENAAEDAATDIATVFTSTFANKAENVAMNFTPIIADPKTGEYKGVLTPAELERYASEVIDAVHPDSLNLQIGAIFTGEDAITQAEQAAERIHQIHEDLYGETGIVSSSMGSRYGLGNSFGGWIDTAEEYAANLTTVENETDLAASAIKEYNENGKISASTYDKLIKSNVGYKDAIKKTTNGIELQTDALKKETIAYIELLKAQYLSQKINTKNDYDTYNNAYENALKQQTTNKEVIDRLGATNTEAAQKSLIADEYNVQQAKNLRDQAKRNYEEAKQRYKEYDEQITLLNKYIDTINSKGFGSSTEKTTSNTKDFTSNTNTYNREDAWLKDQQAKIDKLKDDYNKIDQQLKKAIEAGDEEQIKLLTDLALKKSKELRDNYASIASEGRTRYDNIMSRIYALAPELAGKDIDNITEAEIMAATKRLDDKITAEENKAIAMYNADNEVKDPNKAGIEAAKNAKTYFSAYISEAQEYLKAFKSGEGTFSEGWAEQIEKDSDTIKSEFEALNNIFDKEIENTKRKAESLDLQIDLLDEDDYVNKIDLIGKKSVENANTQARLASEIEKVTREFGNGEVSAEDYQARIDELTDSYNECVQSAQSFKNELKDIAEQEISDITSIESDVKGYLEDYISLVEDNAQKEIDAAEKTADAKKKAIEKQKDALQDYQDQLEKQWDAEDERDARREKLDERNKLATDRAKTLTAAASGDLEALNRIQDLDSEIAKLDKELQEELDKQWREDIKDYIGEQVEALDKQSDKLDEQLDVMKKQLEAAQKTNEELLKGESGYAMVHALMAGNTVKIGNNEVDLNTMIQKLADESGDSSRYGYAYESASWQKDLGLALASVANLDALNSLATGNFSLQNGVIVLGDGSTLDLNNLSGRQPLNEFNQQLSPDGNFVSATGLLGAVTGMQNGIVSNPEIYENLMKQQTELNNNINRLLEKSTDVVIDNLLNIEGDVTEDVIPKIRQALDKYAPAAVQELFNRGVSTGFSRNGVTGKSKWIK